MGGYSSQKKTPKGLAEWLGEKFVSTIAFQQQAKGLPMLEGTARFPNGDVLVNTWGHNDKQVLKNAAKKLKARQSTEKAASKIKAIAEQRVAAKTVKKVVADIFKKVAR